MDKHCQFWVIRKNLEHHTEQSNRQFYLKHFGCTHPYNYQYFILEVNGLGEKTKCALNRQIEWIENSSKPHCRLIYDFSQTLTFWNIFSSKRMHGNMYQYRGTKNKIYLSYCNNQIQTRKFIGAKTKVPMR